MSEKVGPRFRSTMTSKSTGPSIGGVISASFKLLDPAGRHPAGRLAVDDDIDAIDHPARVSAGGEVARSVREALNAFRGDSHCVRASWRAVRLSGAF